jgi:hypothetical protein
MFDGLRYANPPHSLRAIFPKTDSLCSPGVSSGFDPSAKVIGCPLSRRYQEQSGWAIWRRLTRFYFRFFRNHAIESPIPLRQEGRTRRHERGAGMRWTLMALPTSGADRRTTKTCGSGAPRLASSLRDVSQATETTKPGLREERGGNRKTIAQGMFRQKNINKINGESGLCPPLCRDPRQS